MMKEVCFILRSVFPHFVLCSLFSSRKVLYLSLSQGPARTTLQSHPAMVFHNHLTRGFGGSRYGIFNEKRAKVRNVKKRWSAIIAGGGAKHEMLATGAKRGKEVAHSASRCCRMCRRARAAAFSSAYSGVLWSTSSTYNIYQSLLKAPFPTRR